MVQVEEEEGAEEPQLLVPLAVVATTMAMVEAVAAAPLVQLEVGCTAACSALVFCGLICL